MITILNRKELFLTMDTKVQSNIREVLATNNIDYKIRVKNVHPYALDLHSYEYKIYVHKTDYDHACYLIKDVIR